MRRRKGVAVELGVDGDGADLCKPTRFLWAVGDHTRVQIAWACLIDYREFADVHVHVGLDRQLPRRLEDRQARLHRARAPGAHEPARVEDKHAAALLVEGELDCRETAGCVICVRAPRGDGVQVERQREPAAGNGDRLGQLCDR